MDVRKIVSRLGQIAVLCACSCVVPGGACLAASDSIGGVVNEQSRSSSTDQKQSHLLQGQVERRSDLPPSGPIVMPKSDTIGGSVVESAHPPPPKQPPPTNFGCVHYAIPKPQKYDIGGEVVSNNQHVSRIVPKHHDEFIGAVHDPQPQFNFGQLIDALGQGMAITDVMMGSSFGGSSGAPASSCMPSYSAPRSYGCR